MIGNPECMSPSHVFHICALKHCGLNDRNSDTFCGLIRMQQYICGKCGEKSEKPENLCFPEKIETVS